VTEETNAQNAEQPRIKQPPILFDKTQRILEKIAAQLGGPLIAYWNNPMGSVCQNDVVALYEALEKLGHVETINLFIKSSGGNGQSSLRLVNLLRQYCDRLVALIPLECASAATMIALGANEVLMGPMAYLTAVDTSLTHSLSPIDRDNDRVSVSLDELTRVIRLWTKQEAQEKENPYQSLFQYVHPLVIGAVDRAESLSIMLCKELLAFHITDEQAADQIASALNSKYPSHNYPILMEEARRIGLKADPMPADVNTLLLELNELYSEMGQRATTDFDEIHSHSNEILNIWEAAGIQVYYKQDKDWFYRMEERRWITLNDNSAWRRLEQVNGQTEESILHIA
jgi:hypothetical protein